jgi:carotenoid cleavage dioxygenase-like enzyme
VLDASGCVERTVPVDIPRPVMMHDMAITQGHMVFMDHPLVFDGEVRG